MTQYTENWETPGAGAPTGWTTRWNQSSTTYTVEANNRIKFDGQSSSKSLISLDSMDNVDDLDILITLMFNPYQINFGGFGVAARCTGSSGSETGYVCKVRTGGGNFLNIIKYVSGETTSLGSLSLLTALGITEITRIDNRPISIRFNVKADALKAKVWFVLEEAEPGSWDVSITNSDITTGDWAGILSRRATSVGGNFAYSAHFSDDPDVPAVFNSVSGIITDESSAVAERDILLMHRGNKRVTLTTTSDSGDGTYQIYTPFGGEHNILVFDDATSDPLLNDLIHRVIPE